MILKLGVLEEVGDDIFGLGELGGHFFEGLEDLRFVVAEAFEGGDCIFVEGFEGF